MSDECDLCSEHCLECKCRPQTYEEYAYLVWSELVIREEIRYGDIAHLPRVEERMESV